jgi:hypothetical protein
MPGYSPDYKNYKPKDPLAIRYYFTQYPAQVSEVDGWMDAILRKVGDHSKDSAELAILRQVLLATYGQAPTDSDALTFCQDQIWYAPKKDFGVSKLSKDQQAVLPALDRRIDALSKH